MQLLAILVNLTRQVMRIILEHSNGLKGTIKDLKKRKLLSMIFLLSENVQKIAH